MRAAEASRHDCRVAVIDNASTDDSASWLAREFPQVEIFERPNEGLCSYNHVLTELSGRVAVLLNNDIRLAEDCVDPLVDPLLTLPQAGERPIFATAPLCWLFDGQTYEGLKTGIGWRWGLVQATAHFSGHEKHCQTPGLTASAGCVLAVDREKFLELGGFDPLYLPGRLEDLDFCFRGYQAGYQARFVPSAVAYHRGGGIVWQSVRRGGLPMARAAEHTPVPMEESATSAPCRAPSVRVACSPGIRLGASVPTAKRFALAIHAGVVRGVVARRPIAFLQIGDHPRTRIFPAIQFSGNGRGRISAMNHRPSISASIIAQNEEMLLPGLFERLDWVDDIVVVDGGSTDATVQIAESFGARVFQRPFDNFARQQTYALEMCRGDWAFSIDADERPTRALIKEISQRLARRQAKRFSHSYSQPNFWPPFSFLRHAG